MNTLQLIEEKYMSDRNRLVKIFANRAGGKENAEDIVQEAFTRALKYYKTARSPIRGVDEWFNKIVNHVLIEFKRNERLLGMKVDSDLDEEYGGRVLEWEQSLMETVKGEIARKKLPMRQALYLYFFQGYKPREIAQVLDMSNGYIRVTVYEFKTEMRRKYGDIL